MLRCLPYTTPAEGIRKTLAMLQMNLVGCTALAQSRKAPHGCQEVREREDNCEPAACGRLECNVVREAIPGVLGRILESGSVCGVGSGTVGRPVGSPGARRRLEPPLLSATICSRYATCTQHRLMQGWPSQIAGILAVCGKLSTRFACPAADISSAQTTDAHAHGAWPARYGDEVLVCRLLM